MVSGAPVAVQDWWSVRAQEKAKKCLKRAYRSLRIFASAPHGFAGKKKLKRFGLINRFVACKSVRSDQRIFSYFLEDCGRYFLMSNPGPKPLARAGWSAFFQEAPPESRSGGLGSGW